MERKIKEAKIVLLVIAILLFCLTITAFAYNEKEQTIIVLDAGHGGRDGGTVGKDGTMEKDIDLNIALILKRYFENSGIRVIMTRASDMDLSSENSLNHKREDILKRVDIINNSEAVIYLSIHANSYPNSLVKGAQTFYKENDEESKILSELIQSSLRDNLQNTTRVAKSIGGKYLIDNSTKVGALIEVGFLSNSEELALLKTDKYQQKIARCIYLGALEYIKEK